MDNNYIYSIGHGNKELEVFLEELTVFDIKYLLDIRSKPFSKWNPHFNQNQLKSHLKKINIHYIFVGDALGGLPEDHDCYMENGKVSYEIIKTKKFFKDGINRIVTANNKKIKIAIMCSESKPEECHRSKLIGEVLLNNIEKKISINHITSKNKSISQSDVMYELTQGHGTTDLFGSIDFSSRKSYK